MAPTRSGEVNRITRGVILKLLCDNHDKQEHRLNLTLLHAMLTRLGHDLGRDALVTLVQNLKDRGYLTYEELRNRRTWELDIIHIQVTPAGVDLVEETRTDPAVEV